MKYFSIEEFTRSATAVRKGIDNTPSQYQIDNATEFINNMLDPLREGWAMYCNMNGLGSGAITVTSGIRSKALNEAIGGSKTSAHYHGWAVDMVPANGFMSDFKKFCITWLHDKQFDQLISEDEDKNGIPGWIHLGYKNGAGAQRRQMLIMKNNKYYYM
jgi:putative chitinase